MDAGTEIVPIAIPLGAGIGLAACAAIVFCAFFMRKQVNARTLAWAGVFAAFAGFFTIWCGLGLAAADTAMFAGCQATFAACGVLVLQRERFTRYAASCLETSEPGTDNPIGWENARAAEAKRAT